MLLELRVLEVCADLVGRIGGGMRSGAQGWFEKKKNERWGGTEGFEGVSGMFYI